MSHSPPEVLIAAEGDWYGVCRLPKIFHQAGIRTTLLVLPRALARRTRYAKALPLEGAHGVRHIAEALRRHLAENPGKYAMVIPGDDMMVRLLSEEENKSWLRPWFPVDPVEESLRLIQSKAAILAACEADGIPVPRSIPCANLQEALQAARAIGYPVFIKGEDSSGGRGVGRAENDRELQHLIETLPAEYMGGYSVQQAIEGRLGSMAVFAWRGEVIQWSSHYRARTWPEPYGASSQIKFMRHPDIELIARGIAKLTGFHGFFGVDFIHSQQTGHCHVIEMNPRPTPLLPLCARAGADFSKGIRHVLAGGPKPEPLPPIAPKGTYPLFPEELYRCHEQHDYRSIVRWILKVMSGRAEIPWDDYSLAAGMWKKFRRHCKNQMAHTAIA